MTVVAPVAAAPAVDLVVVAADQAADLTAAIRRLHEHVTSRGVFGQAGRDWRLVIADHASTDATSAVAAALAAELPGTEAVRFDDRLDGKAMRARFAHRSAEIVAFLTIRIDSDLDALLAPLAERAIAGSVDVGAAATPTSNAVVPIDSFARRALSRRNALLALGGAGLAALVAACGGSSKTTPAAATDAPTTAGGANAPATTTALAKAPAAAATAAPAGATPLAVEMTQGPYYLNLDLVRSDVREDRKGAALALDLAVVDASGAPIKGAVVDIWHCDSDGVYSGFVTASNASNGGGPGVGGPPPGGGQGGQPGQGGPPPGDPNGGGPGGGPGGGQPGQGATPGDPSTFLRGTQLADAAGKLSFTTIYPGWYQGRAVHIHVMVHVGGNVVHTGQFFFDDTFTDTMYASTAPYSARPTGRLRNTDDGIFGGGGDKSVLAVTKSGDGYQAAMTMAVKTA